MSDTDVKGTLPRLCETIWVLINPFAVVRDGQSLPLFALVVMVMVRVMVRVSVIYHRDRVITGSEWTL